LAVRVAPSGAKTWDLAFRIAGSKAFRRTSLGRFPDVGLDDARDRAGELTRAARAGVDLLAREQAAQAEATSRMRVGQLIDLYVKRRVVGRLRSAHWLEERLRRALGPLLDRHADDIKRRDLRLLLDEVADRGWLAEADKRKGTIRTLFRWALAQDLVSADPTAGLAGYESNVARERVLSPEEIARLWAWLGTEDVPAYGRDALRLQLALGARSGEIAGMEADEIDTSKWIWTLPAARSKNGKARLTPLVGMARDIVEGRLTPGRPLFPAVTGKPSTASHIYRTVGGRHRERVPIATFSPHDLRRTTATGMAEIGIPLDLVASIIGHETGGRDTRTLVRHYVHSDLLARKRAALEAWDRHLKAIVEGKDTANVVALQKAV
jgi:integrase